MEKKQAINMCCMAGW